MNKFIDETGRRYGRLFVLKRIGNRSHGAAFLCLCDCGNKTIVAGGHLRSGGVRSCGCLATELLIKRKTKHGFSPSGNLERLYKVWASMKERTTNPNAPNYKYYGEMGVSVCDEWLADYAVFRKWALENGYDEGANFGKCTIDRIDPSGNYCPSNCRWVGMRTQGNNRRNSRIIEHDGISLTAAQWARKLGMKHSVLGMRLSSGWSEERALTQPVRHRGGGASCACKS